MKLNFDCVRDVLLTIESLNIDQELNSGELDNYELLRSYSCDDVFYTVEKLDEANYINANIAHCLGSNSFIVDSLTWDGHEFLDNIRSNEAWKHVKNVALTAGGVSLSILSELAKQYFSKKFGLS